MYHSEYANSSTYTETKLPANWKEYILLRRDHFAFIKKNNQEGSEEEAVKCEGTFYGKEYAVGYS